MEEIDIIKDDLADAQRELRAMNATLMHIRQQREEFKTKVDDQSARIYHLEDKMETMQTNYSNLDRMYQMALERNEHMRVAMTSVLHRSVLTGNSKKDCECPRCVTLREALEHSIADWKLV
jgi:predicted  nucleic acid-binding Zn-ribbon protein